MNAKKLIIAFMTVSVFALIVSALAVFTVARTYSQRLTDDSTEPLPETAAPKDETEALPTVNDHPETEQSTEAEQSTETEEITEASETSNTEETTSPPRRYTLSLSDGRLIITSPTGEKVCERMADEKSLHPKDKELLLKGIEFDDIESAKSAIYDIIS